MELIVFVGLPAAGKTTYYRAHFAATHVHVSKDRMPNTRDRERRQQTLIEQALAAGASVVVDNTNPSVATREPLIALGRRFGARLMAYYFESNVRLSIVRNEQREGAARVPNIAIFLAQKKLVPPTIEEGFDEVKIVKQEVAMSNEQ
jgi:predicted kinase